MFLKPLGLITSTDAIQKPETSRATATLTSLPDGRAGTWATLAAMRKLVRAFKLDPEIRHFALDLISDLEPKDYKGEIKRIHAFVRDSIRYVQDITDTETLTSPNVMLKIRQGDCDDKVTLLCTLLESIGIPTRMVAVAFRFGEFEHVLAEAKMKDRWFALETTEPVEVGWYPKRVVERLVMYN